MWVERTRTGVTGNRVILATVMIYVLTVRPGVYKNENRPLLCGWKAQTLIAFCTRNMYP